MKFHRINAIIWRHIYGTHRTLHRLVDLFYWPTLDLVLWCFGALWLPILRGLVKARSTLWPFCLAP
ncbi:MAG: hypothetical protein AUJ33_00950 [Parcubacteria group bacterium CG1_02_40_25]|nr:MAG: hypothetical protein AUJ33_00950 [Parcubacteria group bacterium CG1_02_40_25]